jgi:streptomycin 6-kinase
VLRADGSEAVLKVALPGTDTIGHADALRAADGRGYVRLLASAPEVGALLLEGLGRSLDHVGLTPEAQLDALVATLVTAWRAPDRAAFDQAGSLVAAIRSFSAQRPDAVESRVVDEALACAALLTDPDPADLVAVHGDPHPGNLLRVRQPRRGAETGWCFVDPEPRVAERAYDLGVTVRDFSATLLAEPGSAADRVWSWCVRVAAPGGVDPRRVWAWGLLARVWTGCHVTAFGAPRVGEPFLRSAVLLVDQQRPF